MSQLKTLKESGALNVKIYSKNAESLLPAMEEVATTKNMKKIFRSPATKDIHGT
jgi:L-rhamnose mutarotase